MIFPVETEADAVTKTDDDTTDPDETTPEADAEELLPTIEAEEEALEETLTIKPLPTDDTGVQDDVAGAG